MFSCALRLYSLIITCTLARGSSVPAAPVSTADSNVLYAFARCCPTAAASQLTSRALAERRGTKLERECARTRGRQGVSRRLAAPRLCSALMAAEAVPVRGRGAVARRGAEAAAPQQWRDLLRLSGATLRLRIASHPEQLPVPVRPTRAIDARAPEQSRRQCRVPSPPARPPARAPAARQCSTQCPVRNVRRTRTSFVYCMREPSAKCCSRPGAPRRRRRGGTRLRRTASCALLWPSPSPPLAPRRPPIVPCAPPIVSIAASVTLSCAAFHLPADDQHSRPRMMRRRRALVLHIARCIAFAPLLTDPHRSATTLIDHLIRVATKAKLQRRAER